MILKGELSSKHTFKAINSYAIPALSYGLLLWWNWPGYSATGCHEEIVPEIHHQIRTHQQTGGGTQKKKYA